MRNLFIISCFLLTQLNVKAQSGNDNEFAKPDWASMIDSNSINYYTAVTAFEQYWNGKEKPVEEEDIFENAPTENEIIDSEKLSMGGEYPSGIVTDELKKEMRHKAFLAFEYKRFKDWQQDVLPYVQPDGRILSEKEKEIIWLKQKGN